MNFLAYCLCLSGEIKDMDIIPPSPCGMNGLPSSHSYEPNISEDAQESEAMEVKESRSVSFYERDVNE